MTSYVTSEGNMKEIKEGALSLSELLFYLSAVHLGSRELGGQ